MSLTAGVKEKDRRIAELEDLVRDLLAIRATRVDPRPGLWDAHWICSWCNGATATPVPGPIVHDVDCPVPRADAALIRRLY